MEFQSKNGHVHTYIFSTGGMNLKKSGDDKEANEMLNEVLDTMQEQGYEVLDVKMNTALGGLGQTIVRFLITYK
jgi:hypothetical protein